MHAQGGSCGGGSSRATRVVSSAIFSSMSTMTRSELPYAPVPISSARSATSRRTSFSSARFSARMAAVTGAGGGRGAGENEAATRAFEVEAEVAEEAAAGWL